MRHIVQFADLGLLELFSAPALANFLLFQLLLCSAVRGAVRGASRVRSLVCIIFLVTTREREQNDRVATDSFDSIHFLVGFPMAWYSFAEFTAQAFSLETGGLLGVCNEA